ncbi:MAG: recombinase family protein [Firmicutes bacterium]|nr:recombinase family protein [Bacillota bacterium]
MAKKRKVIAIQPTSPELENGANGEISKKKVAAYTRVSTNEEQQQQSHSAQMDYYLRYITSNPNWEFVKVYTDKGISATNRKNRTGFNSMIADAVKGKIDLIITKSISRFARNTVDTLTIIRKLKEHDVEVFFEKENLYTLDSKGEIMITILSSLAQEESRNISENVAWGIRKRFADGKFSLPYKNFLGYQKGEDGYPEIVEEEAQIIRYIYKLAVDGKSAGAIAKILTVNNIPSPSGKPSWESSVVRSILTNEKYAGNAILQKTFTSDFLTKKKKINNGALTKYIIENSHEPIIPIDIYEAVQKILAQPFRKNNIHIMSSRVFCGVCGSRFTPYTWHSTSKYYARVWECQNRKIVEPKCTATHIYQDDLHSSIVSVLNSIINNKGRLIKNLKSCLFESIGSYSSDKRKTKEGIVNEYIDKLRSAENVIDEVDDDIFSGAIEKIIVFDDTLEFKLKYSEKSLFFHII